MDWGYLLFVVIACHACVTTQDENFNKQNAHENTLAIANQQTQCVDTESHYNLEDSYFHKHLSAKKKYNFDFFELPIREAANEISEATGTLIMVDENVTGIVTAKISNLSIEKVIQIIVASGPYDYKVMDDYIFIGVVDLNLASWTKLAHHKVFKVYNVLPSKLINSINSVFKEYITADDDNKTISILAPRKIIRDLLSQFEKLDKQPRLIQLRLSISEYSEKATQILGRSKLTGTAADIGGVFNPLIGPYKKLDLSNKSAMDFLSTFSTLESNGEIDIKAQPTLVVVEGEEAIVKYSAQKIITSATPQEKPIILNYDTGFRVVARIGANNDIILSIKEAKSSDFNNEMDKSYELKEQIIATTIRLHDGETIMIGGMYKEKERNVITKIPLIGDLPLIGWFFKNKQKEVIKVETVFSITPEFVCGGVS